MRIGGLLRAGLDKPPSEVRTVVIRASAPKADSTASGEPTPGRRKPAAHVVVDKRHCRTVAAVTSTDRNSLQRQLAEDGQAARRRESGASAAVSREKRHRCELARLAICRK